LPAQRAGLALQFELNAFAEDATAMPVRQFDKPFELRVDLSGLVDLDALAYWQYAYLAYFDEEKQQWVDIPAYRQGSVLVAQLDHFSTLGGGAGHVYQTGWRLGYVIAPPGFIRAMQKIQQNLFICAPSFAQAAAVAALTECAPHVAEMVRIYDRRRRYLLERLQQMGIATRFAPAGAFYTLANVRKFTADSYSFAFEILEKAKVALTPGIDFGKNAEGYLRISYANSLENIKEGLDRLERFLARYCRR